MCNDGALEDNIVCWSWKKAESSVIVKHGNANNVCDNDSQWAGRLAGDMKVCGERKPSWNLMCGAALGRDDFTATTPFYTLHDK